MVLHADGSGAACICCVEWIVSRAINVGRTVNQKLL